MPLDTTTQTRPEALTGVRPVTQEDLGKSIEIELPCVPDADYPANARLIAAAPELLAALRVADYALTYVLDTAGDQLDASERADLIERREQARAAIAKATIQHLSGGEGE
jgi:hypothetical protein